MVFSFISFLFKQLLRCIVRNSFLISNVSCIFLHILEYLYVFISSHWNSIKILHRFWIILEIFRNFILVFFHNFDAFCEYHWKRLIVSIFGVNIHFNDFRSNFYKKKSSIFVDACGICSVCCFVVQYVWLCNTFAF